MGYLTVEQFRARALMHPGDVDTLDPAFVLQALDDASGWIDDRLRKRYAVPFASPVPVTILRWVAHLAAADCYLRRGADPADAAVARFFDFADRARAEVKEAADSAEGLFDLPLKADTPGISGVTQGGPFGYSETDPYAWLDVQRDLRDT